MLPIAFTFWQGALAYKTSIWMSGDRSFDLILAILRLLLLIESHDMSLPLALQFFPVKHDLFVLKASEKDWLPEGDAFPVGRIKGRDLMRILLAAPIIR